MDTERKNHKWISGGVWLNTRFDRQSRPSKEDESDGLRWLSCHCRLCQYKRDQFATLVRATADCCVSDEEYLTPVYLWE